MTVLSFPNTRRADGQHTPVSIDSRIRVGSGRASADPLDNPTSPAKITPVVIRGVYPSLSLVLPDVTGNYGPSAGMFCVRRSGRFHRQGLAGFHEFFGPFIAARRAFHSLLQLRQKTSSRFAKCFKSFRLLLGHGPNHDRRNVGNARKVSGEIRNVEC